MDFNLIKQRIGEFTTPFYCYDLGILHRTINACKSALPDNFHVHFALKANTEDKILSALSANGFGADCVSGYEVKHALENGFKPKDIVFAGVGKSDAEIQYALDSNIDCFNVESVQELEVIAELAKKSNKIARVALRLNPNVKADTHHYITTGIGDNKFGIDARDVESASEVIKNNGSVLPARLKSIPVYLKNTMNPAAKGTLISEETEPNRVKALAAKDGITSINIRSGRMLMAYGFLRSVFEVFERYQTAIDLITTSEVAISVTIDDKTHLQEILKDLRAYGVVSVEEEQSIVCIVGDNIGSRQGLAVDIFKALSPINIRMISFGGSQHNVSLLVGKEDKAKCLNLLNEVLF